MANNQNGSGFVNFSDYLNANKGNQVGDALANNINSFTSNVANNLGQQQSDFSNAANAQNLDTSSNATYRDNLIKDASGYNASGTSDPSDPNYNANAITDNDISKFGQFRSGAYTGPTGLADTGTLTNDANTLGQYNNQLKTSAGKQSLLQTMFGGAGYTSGEAGLDTSLMGNAGKLNTAAKNATDTAAAVRQGIQSAQDTAQNITQNNSNFGKQTRQLLGLDDSGNFLGTQNANGDYTNGGAIQNYYNGVNARYHSDLNQQNSDFNTIINHIQNHTLTSDDLSKLGWSADTPYTTSQRMGGHAISGNSNPSVNGVTVINGMPVINTYTLPTAQQYGTGDWAGINSSYQNDTSSPVYLPGVSDKTSTPYVGMDTFGISALQGNTQDSSGNYSSGQYLQKTDAPTLNTVATQSDADKLLALSKLAGINDSFLPTDPTSADYKSLGKYDPKNEFKFNDPLFMSDISRPETQALADLNRAGYTNPADALSVAQNGGMTLNQAIRNSQEGITSDPTNSTMQSQYQANLGDLNALLSKYGYGTTKL